MNGRPIICPQCGVGAFIATGAANRARKIGAPIYCGRECAGLARRAPPKPEADRIADKAAYDRRRRVELADRLRAEHRAYHLRTYDPAKAAVVRKAKMPRHVEYCRQPAYKEYKRDYDRKHRAKQQFGPFWEAALLVEDINREVISRASRYEIKYNTGTTNKVQRRRRDYEQTVGG